MFVCLGADIAEGQHPAVCLILDKGDKVPRSVLQEELQKILLDSPPEQISQLLETINVSTHTGQIKYIVYIVIV
jgi:hypothetical protein